MKFNPYALSSILDSEKFQALVDAPEIEINAPDVLAAWTLFCQLHEGEQDSNLTRAKNIIVEVFIPGAAWKRDPALHEESVQYHYSQIVACNPGWRAI